MRSHSVAVVIRAARPPARSHETTATRCPYPTACAAPDMPPPARSDSSASRLPASQQRTSDGGRPPPNAAKRLHHAHEDRGACRENAEATPGNTQLQPPAHPSPPSARREFQETLG